MNVDDKEIIAFAKVKEALEGLSEPETMRVVQWAVSKYMANVSPTLFKPATPFQIEATAQDENIEEGDVVTSVHDAYPYFADMLVASGTDKSGEKALVAAYWLKVKENQEEWTSADLNKLLSAAGKEVDHINRPLDTLMTTKPIKVIQVGKVQGKKRAATSMKLTRDGIDLVESLLKRD